MKILITGINGFAASHLARKLLENGHEVHGTVRVRSDLFKIEDIKNKLTLHLVELTDAHSVAHLIETIKPEQIYHLAAQSYVKSSWDSPNETMDINYDGTVNILEAVKRLEDQPSILVTSTSETYGYSKKWMDENTVQAPNTPYGISKLAQEQIALCYHKAFNMKVIITRSFNIIGAGRSEVFVDSNFAKQIVEIEKGLREPKILHGNLESARDFVNISDVIEAYIRVMNSSNWGQVYCIATGIPTKIQTILDTMVRLSTVKEIILEVDPDRMRPVDTPTMKGNANKIKRDLFWEPLKTLEESCLELLEYWRNKL